ncbi:exodeoxyribonuclease X [Promicromonospora umidemergens]|uniref:3'-5' exonuclease n=2 Tax=Promicromonospora TaxID=43676 RepID=A0ABP8XUL6_9MICO|nr:3'-5' exonuclease [Promicromonospora umidemergens]MCP2287009.1 exodeoxyribonuclease X [Promicromonospora umidemergens]
MSMVWDEADYVVVDVEGNGARPPELVEVAVVPVRRGKIEKARTWLLRPPTPISWQAHKIHGISNDDVADAPAVGEVAGEIRAVLGSAIPVGHGVHVDVDVLRRSLPGWEVPVALDTLKLARRAFDLPSYGLSALVEHRHLADGLPPGMRAHRADYDATVTARLFVQMARLTPGTTLEELRQAGAMGSSSKQAPAVAADATLFDL